MPDKFLVFQLYGALASWGDIAVGEVRPSFDHPTKSAILGLIGAALGLKRSDTLAHQCMIRDYGFAVRVDKSGTLLQDYHTVQMPSGKGARNLPTRRDELKYPKLGSLLSTRAYLMDAFALVCLWLRTDKPRWALTELRDHLITPVFTPYLGRKACPPGLPFNPQVLTADTVKDAMQYYNERQPEVIRNLFKTPKNELIPARVYFDEDARHGYERPVSLVRRDIPLSRTKWLFDERREYYVELR